MERENLGDVTLPERRYLAPGFDPSQAKAVEDAAGGLLARPVASGKDLGEWLVDWSELSSSVRAGHARRMIATHRDTHDARVRATFLAFVREVLPLWEQSEDRLTRAYLASPHRESMGEEYGVFDRSKRLEARLYREENRGIQARLRELTIAYTELQGGIMVEFDGERVTPQRCMAHLASPDRDRREAAWRAVNQRFLLERERIDTIFDEMLDLRQKMARNAGFDDYLSFRFAEMERFDYAPEDCRQFHEAIHEVGTPVLGAAQEARRARLGLATLRPWDLDVSPFGGEAPSLFSDQEEFIDLTRRVFARVDPRFSAEFDLLVRRGLLDLMSREGKAPGGYNCPLEDVRLPFIFFNAVGRREDLRVLLHEGGHAFHSLAAREQALIEYRRAPLEFCEVASMSMELFGLERLEGVLESAVARTTLHAHLDRIVRTFAQVAHIDAFQHWLYGNPGHSSEERGAEWLRLGRRFGGVVRTEGLDGIRANAWQRIPHLFQSPLYYVEYGIAQIGALQMWRNYRSDPAATIEAYRSALSLGGSRPLAELFGAAGIRFALDEEILRELLPLIAERLRELEA